MYIHTCICVHTSAYEFIKKMREEKKEEKIVFIIAKRLLNVFKKTEKEKTRKKMP